MKTSMALKPLAFALAALMAVAAQAGGYHAPTTAAATTLDGQSNHGNLVINSKTKNNASINDSNNHNSGVTNSNALSGDNNQGKNDVAIVSGDADFVFASTGTAQSNTGNVVVNTGTKNNASLNDSGNNASGIVQLNAAAGTSNQTSNSVAIASGNGDAGGAAVTAVQDVSGNLTFNSSGHGWNSKPVVNNASINNSMNYGSGVMNSNSVAGSNNQGQNNVAITRF
ncbi:heme utilization protein [Pseudomonas palleroniana]